MVHPPAKFRHKLQFAEQSNAMGSTWSAAVQGPAKRLWIGCVNAAAKLGQKYVVSNRRDKIHQTWGPLLAELCKYQNIMDII